MPRIIKSGLIQMSIPKSEGDGTIDEIKSAIEAKHIPYIDKAGQQGGPPVDTALAAVHDEGKCRLQPSPEHNFLNRNDQ